MGNVVKDSRALTNTIVVAFFFFSAGVGNLHHHSKRLKGLDRHIFHMFQQFHYKHKRYTIISQKHEKSGNRRRKLFINVHTIAVYTKFSSTLLFAKPIDSSEKECFHILYTSFWITHFVTRIKTLCYIDFVLLMQLIVP